MSRFVALFRGINVGRAKRIAMADLRALLESLGCTNVKTLLNSGNAVFDARVEAPELARRIRATVAKKLGVDAFVVVKTHKEIAAVVKGNKLGSIATDPSRLLVALTSDASGLARLSMLAKTEWKEDVVHVGQDAAYIWCPNGSLQSKAALALLRDLGESGTTRNWATIEKIDALLCAK
jgi:uncharacterized protein (DUF1697 family)